MVIFWVSVLALSILLYVLLDGFDLGVGILFGLTRDEHRRRAMMSAVAPVWDGNETWLVVAGVVLWGAFPVVYATLFSALYLPLLLMLAGLILRGVAFEFRPRARTRGKPFWTAVSHLVLDGSATKVHGDWLFSHANGPLAGVPIP